MLPSLNYDSNDPKLILLGKIFKIIDAKNFRDMCSRNGIKNREMMIKSIKILFIALYFDYNIFNAINELNRGKKLRKFLGFSGEVPEASRVYEYLSRYSAEQYCKIVNSVMMQFNKETMGQIQ